MRPHDIYDDMPEGEAQRRHNQQRLAELERESAARQARLAQLVAYADLSSQAIQPAAGHVL